LQRLARLARLARLVAHRDIVVGASDGHERIALGEEVPGAAVDPDETFALPPAMQQRLDVGRLDVSRPLRRNGVPRLDERLE
jgi:hypothetical protein